MIVVARNYGQLGNRLLLQAHLIAAAREYGVTLVNPAFAEYAALFRSTERDLWCRYPRLEAPRRETPPKSWTRRLVYLSVYLTGRLLSIFRLTQFPCSVIRLRSGESCDLAGEDFARRVRTGRPVLVSGWLFRSEPLLAKHAGAIRDHFALAPRHRSRVDETIAAIRRECDVLVGVHIRHGDYATWQGGRYFYSLKQYARAMRSVEAQLPGRRVTFLVCGNGKLCTGDFPGLNVRLGPGHAVEDMYAFAETDLLIGPPSTFTAWAAFYGEVPRIEMCSGDQPVEVPPRLARARPQAA